MDFDFSDDEKAIKDQVRRVLNDRPHAMREAFEGSAPFDPTTWQQAIDLGWLGIGLDEAHGGLGLGYVALCGIAEELGRALAPIPFSSSMYLASEALIVAGNTAQKSRYLPTLADGSQIGTLAFAESRIAADAEPSRIDDGKLYGTKVAVSDGLSADLAVVSIGGDDPALYVVNLGEPGVRREPAKGIDASRPLATLHFTGAAAERLEAASGVGTLDWVLARAAVLFAFEQLGGAQAALDLAKSYALQRVAFGRPIGSFQAIKHKLAECYVSIELARSLAYYAAWALNTDAPDLPSAAAAARLAATAAFEQAARDVIQTHGGIGMTWEHDAHLFYRRSRHLALLIGESGQWRNRLMDEIAGPRRNIIEAGKTSHAL